MSFWALASPCLFGASEEDMDRHCYWNKLWHGFIGVSLQAADTQVVSDYVRYFLNQHTWALTFCAHCMSWSTQLIKEAKHVWFEVLVLLEILKFCHHAPCWWRLWIGVNGSLTWGKCSLKKTCRIQLGREATVKTAATLVKELAYQNKVSLCCIMKVI